MIPNWLMIVGVALALVLGLVFNHRARRRYEDEDGLGVSDLVTPLTTLAVVLLAFVMVESLSSFGRAREDIGQEARAVDKMSESAARLADEPAGTRIQQALICYARAVQYREWPAMADGARAPEVGVWTRVVGTEIAGIDQNADVEVGRLVDLDSERGEARLARITESSPTIPAGLNWLMLAAVLVSVFGLAMFASSKARREVALSLLVVLALFMAATLFTINDLDRPFSGLNALQPTEMNRIETSLSDDLALHAPGAEPPCTDDGDRR